MCKKDKYRLLPCEAVLVDWHPISWFPWVECRVIINKPLQYLTFRQYRWRKRNAS